MISWLAEHDDKWLDEFFTALRRGTMKDHIKLAVEALRSIADGSYYAGKSYDAENQHSDADDVLCGLLAELGYADVVEAWGKVPKWYS